MLIRFYKDKYEDYFFLCMYLALIKKKDEKHSRYKKSFYKSLHSIERARRNRHIPRPSLLSADRSPWRKLYTSMNDSAMITLTGLDIECFHWMCFKCKPYFDNYSPWLDDDTGNMVLRDKTRGRPRIICVEDCVGLNLAWTRTQGSLMSLQLIFGLTYTHLSTYVRYGRRILIKVLKDEEDSKVKIPSLSKIAQYQNAIFQKYPMLDGVWCTMDGLKLNIEESSDFIVQNRFYNGWTHGHYVSSVIVFCPDGTIPILCYNVPGCIHDSTIAEWGEIYEKLESVYDTECKGKCTVDSAFCRKTNPFLIKSSQSDPISDDPNDLVINREATSMRQSAEWGMRGFQASFPRLKDKMKYEEGGERKKILKLSFLLYNLRARRVGINQIRNVFMPSLERNVNDVVPIN